MAAPEPAQEADGDGALFSPASPASLTTCWSLTDKVPAALFIVESGVIVFANQGLAELTGQPLLSLIRRPFAELLAVEDQARAAALATSGHCGAHESFHEFHLTMLDGTLRTIEVRCRPFDATSGRLAGLAIDATLRRRTEERLRRIALHDYLTNLPNRLLFIDRLHQAIAMARRIEASFALLWIDLDGFKEVNDRYGHTVGDLLLQRLSHRMHSLLRESDTLARMGGDEFAALVMQAGSPGAVQPVASKLLAALSKPMELGDSGSIAISGSIGIAFFPDDGADVDSLIQHADTAMYAAKSLGKNAYRFYRGNMASLAQRQQSNLAAEWHHDLHRLLAEVAGTVRANTPAASVRTSIERFLRCCAQHFLFEEPKIKTCADTVAQSHRQDHARLLAQIEDLLLQAGERPNSELVDRLSHEIESHIRDFDEAR